MRVVIADDAVLLREGAARLLEDAGFEVVAQAPTPMSCFARSGHTSPTSRSSTFACRLITRTTGCVPR